MARNYIIIGTGPAGVTAAQAIEEIDSKAEITLIGDEPYAFYSRPGLAYYLTGETSERQLMLPQAAFCRHIKTRVARIFPDAHYVITADGKNYTYDKLLLATGSTATKLTLPGSDLKGVVKLDNLDDAKGILKAARRAKAGVVTGGGITALEIVEALISRGVQTHYVFRSDRFWPNVLDETESGIVEKRLEDRGVHLHRKSELAQITGKNCKITGVETKNGESIKCQLLAVAIGVQPRLELAASAGLKTDRGVLVSWYLQTSAPDVYAAGDIVQALDPLTGKSGLDTLWANALEQGRVAGKNMAGKQTRFQKNVPFNVTRLAGITTTIIGTVGQGSDADLLTIARGDSETWRQVPNVMAVQSDYEVNRTRIMVGLTQFIGAIVMGDQTLSRPLHQLIAGGADITPIRATLLMPDARLEDIIIEFWMNWGRNREALKH